MIPLALDYFFFFVSALCWTNVALPYHLKMFKMHIVTSDIHTRVECKNLVGDSARAARSHQILSLSFRWMNTNARTPRQKKIVYSYTAIRNTWAVHLISNFMDRVHDARGYSDRQYGVRVLACTMYIRIAKKYPSEYLLHRCNCTSHKSYVSGDSRALFSRMKNTQKISSSFSLCRSHWNLE